MVVFTIRVYLLAAHEVVRQELRTMLEASGEVEVVGQSASAAEAAVRIPALRPEVAVLDVGLADGSGIEVCRAIRSVDHALGVLFLTSYDDDHALLTAVVAGADGYVLKRVRGNDLLEGIRKVAAGHSLMDPVLTARALQRVRRHPAVHAEHGRLTGREVTLLGHLAARLSDSEISVLMALDPRTVANDVSVVLEKLGCSRGTHRASTAPSTAPAAAPVTAPSNDTRHHGHPASGVVAPRTTTACGGSDPPVSAPAKAAGADDLDGSPTRACEAFAALAAAVIPSASPPEHADTHRRAVVPTGA
jgi:DNA-binding NarL/FixJ family response regulator